jgi:hypothetical protein
VEEFAQSKAAIVGVVAIDRRQSGGYGTKTEYHVNKGDREAVLLVLLSLVDKAALNGLDRIVESCDRSIDLVLFCEQRNEVCDEYLAKGHLEGMNMLTRRSMGRLKSLLALTV